MVMFFIFNKLIISILIPIGVYYTYYTYIAGCTNGKWGYER
jgi:hypothetical protein